jgi:hypothetical protein
LRYFLKGILVKNHGFLVGITLLWFQIGLFSCGQRTHVSLEENPVCYDVQHPAHCSPVIIEIIFEGYISGKSEFSRRRKPQFVIISWKTNSCICQKKTICVQSGNI